MVRRFTAASVYCLEASGAAVTAEIVRKERDVELIKVLSILSFDALDSLELLQNVQADRRIINPGFQALRQTLKAKTARLDISSIGAGMELKTLHSKGILSFSDCPEWPKVEEKIKRKLHSKEESEELLSIGQLLQYVQRQIKPRIMFAAIERPPRDPINRFNLMERL